MKKLLFFLSIVILPIHCISSKGKKALDSQPPLTKFPKGISLSIGDKIYKDSDTIQVNISSSFLIFNFTGFNELSDTKVLRKKDEDIKGSVNISQQIDHNSYTLSDYISGAKSKEIKWTYSFQSTKNPELNKIFTVYHIVPKKITSENQIPLARFEVNGNTIGSLNTLIENKGYIEVLFKIPKEAEEFSVFEKEGNDSFINKDFNKKSDLVFYRELNIPSSQKSQVFFVMTVPKGIGKK